MPTEHLSRTFRFAADHPVFAGHFPGHPVVPAALLIDRVTAVLAERWPHSAGHLTLVQAKFLRPVGPGQAVDLRLGWDGGEAPRRWQFSLLLDGQVASSGVLALSDDPA